MKTLLTGFLLLLVTVFAACQGVTAASGLEGVEWHLYEMQGAVVAPRPGIKQPTLLLDPSTMKVAGFNGCNNYFSQYKLDGTSLTFGPIGTTRRACPDAESVIERNFLDALQKTRTWKIENGRLALLGDGQVLIRFDQSLLLH